MGSLAAGIHKNTEGHRNTLPRLGAGDNRLTENPSLLSWPTGLEHRGYESQAALAGSPPGSYLLPISKVGAVDARDLAKDALCSPLSPSSVVFHL